MKIKELISELQKFDENLEIKINSSYTEHWCDVPLINGGLHSITNLIMSCLSCNSSKLNF